MPFLRLPDQAHVVFISHRWLRPWWTKEECEGEGHVWAGAPHPDDAKRSKHSLVVRGVRQMAQEKGWDEGSLYVWLDFCGIEQDDVPRKLAGIRALLGYVLASDAVLVPCAERPDDGTQDVDQIPLG